MSAQTDWEAAISRALEILHEVIEESVDEDQISISGVVVELYLVSMIKDIKYWPVSFELVELLCDRVGADKEECHGMAMTLLAQAQREIAELN